MDFGDNTLGAGATPLMRAARAGDHAVIRLLLDKGAEREGDDQRRQQRADVRRRRRLSRQEHARHRERRARVGQGDDGRRSRPQPDQHARREQRCTARRCAAPTRSSQFLLDQKMDINATSKQGYTPLDVALGKTIVGQLPVPQDSTVALLKKLGGKEGPGPQRGAKPPAAP